MCLSDVFCVVFAFCKVKLSPSNISRDALSLTWKCLWHSYNLLWLLGARLRGASVREIIALIIHTSGRIIICGCWPRRWLGGLKFVISLSTSPRSDVYSSISCNRTNWIELVRYHNEYARDTSERKFNYIETSEGHVAVWVIAIICYSKGNCLTRVREAEVIDKHRCGFSSRRKQNQQRWALHLNNILNLWIIYSLNSNFVLLPRVEQQKKKFDSSRKSLRIPAALFIIISWSALLQAVRSW